ncbi:hypothetical protein HanRHA438_Chr11g0528911 [Helianthus annuus]|uniref:Uncharacterized protein n=1 Tax=Helianthus annuus TaxID=4232 RepID=A0A9K3HT33_HELAN|nr:hypothetical protein HanXRQr2_Chr11g0517201 [Helianthus annuus]KAJ0511798.1 hypothetical protein HanIR_Chr11g0556071 [Helianthus annuus]KAJ0872894.1 hypothetical protein HanRHA438_Chr11g0528911 [Helianthus annuus]KAJ0894401.1 hypothetical protein HanPSC8_Chr09g0388651 [Helianthus annuus]
MYNQIRSGGLNRAWIVLNKENYVREETEKQRQCYVITHKEINPEDRTSDRERGEQIA